MEPVAELLPPEDEQADLYRKLGEFAGLLRETLHLGTHVLKWSIDTKPAGDGAVPPLLLFRRFLELLDAVAVQLDRGCSAPSKVTLRAMLETQLGLAYMLESDTERRAYAYLVAGVRGELSLVEKTDETTNRGKQLRAELAGDKLGRSWLDRENPTSDRERLERRLAQPHYKEANAEFERTKQARGGTPEWYSLYGGPRDLRSLAKHLGLLSIYEIIYRWLSAAAHGTDTIRGNLSRVTGGAAVRQLRLPHDAQAVTFYALWMALEVLKTYAARYTTTGEAAIDALAIRIKPAIDALNGPSQIVIKD